MKATSIFDQDRIAAARIMVVGCGALGNEVLKGLVLMGVGHIVVVDFDVVEVGNLSRSVLFTKADAERQLRKVDVVKTRLLQMNPELDICTICGDVSYDVGLDLFRSQDVVIGCVDNRWARYCINRLCMRAGIPWVDGGIENLEGTARVFVPGKNCYACNLGPKGLEEMARRMPCSGIIRRQEASGAAPTTAIVASVIGAVQVQEALKLVHSDQLDEGELTSLCGKMFYYDGQHLTTKLIDFQAFDEDCPVHDQWTPVLPSTLTPDATVVEALESICTLLAITQATICLENDCFVDYVESRDDNQRTSTMCPGRAVEDFIEHHQELSGSPLSGFYQHEYREVDDSFPYKKICLSQLGIPARDILHVLSGEREYFIAMKEQ